MLECVPDVEAGRRFGARFDLQYGQATETLQGSLANEPRPWVYRNIFQAYGTYVFPLGSGLTVDFGKWASSLGIESNYTKDQWNYSRSYWFDYLPFYHMGARVSYRFNDTRRGELLAHERHSADGSVQQLQGSAVRSGDQPGEIGDLDDQLLHGARAPRCSTDSGSRRAIAADSTWFVCGADRSAPDGRLHILDSYATWQATPKTAFSLEGDYVVSRLWNEPGPGRSTAPSHVYGGAVYARQQVTTKAALAARGEYLRDDGGLFSGVTQSLKETTLTYEYKVSDGFLMRAEWREISRTSRSS